MKRFLRRFLLSLLAALSLTAFASAEPSTFDPSATSGTLNFFTLTWTFDEATGTLTVSGNGYIPGYSADQFPWHHRRAAITAVVLEEGVTSIGTNAFLNCTNLTSVSFPQSLTGHISNSAFQNCTSLTSAILPDDVHGIGDYAFAGCTSLSTLTLPKRLVALGVHAFQDCTSLTAVEYPDSIITVPQYAFAGCTALERVTFPSNKYLIYEEGAFDGCSSLVSIDFTENIYPESWSHPADAIYFQGALTSVQPVEANVFRGCASLTNSIVMESYVTTVGPAAFEGCASIKNVILPESLTQISDGAFYNCTSLAQVIYTGSTEGWSDVFVGQNNDSLLQAELLLICPGSHNWDEGTVILPATCTTNGLLEYACTFCIMTTTENIPASGHIPVIDWAFSPTCTQPGQTEGSHCYGCGEVYVASQIIPPTGHTEVIYPAHAPSCTEFGLTEGRACSVCHEVLHVAELLPPTDHKEVVIPATPPTCTDIGFTEGRRCEVCGLVILAQKILLPTDHTEVTLTGAPPSCTETGLSDGKHCAFCGKVTAAQTELPALGHSMVDDEAIPPTCLTSGLSKGKHCARCGKVVTAQEIVPPLNHRYDNKHDTDCNLCGAVRDVDTKPSVSGAQSIALPDAAVSIVVKEESRTVSVYEDGSFSLDVTEGSFDVVVKIPGALTQTVKNIAATGADISLPSTEVVKGDTNGDDMINIMDMAAFRQNFGKTGAAVQNAFTDTNGDGMVNIMDMGTFRMNFGKTAAKDCTVEYSA